MAVKCNIVGLVLNKLYNLQYELECKDYSNDIIENYIEYLDCDIPGFVPCNIATDCRDNVTISECRLTVNKIVIISRVLNTIVYGVDLVGGVAPFTYQWIFDTTDFNNSGTVDTNQATLTVKGGKNLALIVSPISVTVTDSEGCKYTKNCTLIPEGLRCNDNYVPCPNISNLQVASKFTYCARPENLVVTNT